MATVDKKSNLDKWLALKQQKKVKASPRKITPHAAGTEVPLSYGQQRLWLLQQLYADSPFYNYAHIYHFEGALDVEQLQASLQTIAARHALTTTAFRQNAAGEVVQYQELHRQLSCPLIDLSDLSAQAREQAFNDTLETAKTYVFDFEEEPLLRGWLVRRRAEEYTLVLLIHHIIGDRGSLQIFNQELAEHYRNSTTNTTAPALPDLPLTYADFAYWQRQRTVPDAQIDYWLKQLAPPLPFLELPADYPPPAQPSFRGQTLRRTLPADLSNQVKALAKQQQATLFMLGLAAFQTLLYRYTGQTDICIGTPLSNRNQAELAGIMGFFNETVVLRSDLSQAGDFVQLLTAVKRHTLSAFSNQDVPFDLLVQRLQPERRAGLNPLFQAMFVMNEQQSDYEFGSGLHLTEESLEMEVAKFDLTLFLTDTPSGLELALEYSADRFESPAVRRMLGHLEVLLTAIVATPATPLAQLPLLSEEENNQILTSWNSTRQPVPEVASIIALIDRQIKERPGHPAAVFGDTQLTYAELDQRANILSRHLQQLADHRLANRFVGLAVGPSVELVVGILGIMRAGAAYLPIDPTYPAARIEYMLEDAELIAVVTTQELAPKLPIEDLPRVYLENLEPLPDDVSGYTAKADDLAYMIYTSGSTGQPKGVPISHRNLLYSTAARFAYYDQQPGTFLLLSSFAFDSSVAGIFWTLSSGGTLVLAPRRLEQDINALAELISHHGVSHTLLLPSLYGLVLEFAAAQQLKSLEVVMVAGEACSAKVVRQHFGQLPETTLYNEYGPTEATVWSTAHRLSTSDADGNIPIGKPIPNYTNYILDAQQQLVPIGVTGELYIGGPGLTRGYWNRPELNAERFFPNPFGPDRLYRTGDSVRLDSDGNIEFLGRVDKQVKVRGHRIELGEIERQLLAIPPVQEAVVLADEQQGLLAWVTTREDFDPQAGLQWLRRRLPNYMIPGRLAQIDEFPRLPNGKLDRQQLLAVNPAPTLSEQAPEPQDELEQQLLDIWRKVLRHPQLTVLDNFFTAGGDSLQSIRVIAQAQKADIPLSPNLLFEYPSIRELVQFLQEEASAESTWQSVSMLSKGSEATPALFCLHSGAAHVFFYRDLADYLSDDFTVYALQAQGLEDTDQLPSSIEEMASYYLTEIKRVQPQGPYMLLGTCFSNAVGLEMAHQLQEAGDKISRLIFVDSGPAHLQSLRKKEGKRTLHRFGQLLQGGDWRGIAKKLRNRSIVTARKARQPFKSASAQRLQRTIDNLNDLYARYDWTSYAGDIYFVRSSEFAERPDKDYHVEQWTKLTEGKLSVSVVPGHHLTLFAEPEVRGLAVTIASILQEQ